ncbi:peptide ABC transporter permease [Leuconostoc litchii]|uniref:FtsX-like permease family protein n=1 Tax=Leuconostoc litchii TaxID=1981069 RepID=A0A6P2CJN5_9LACO|nr:ABC transporter permease [Leuconostoc litchii]TYC46050.1 FtsX-like permease family protein [Leuconostoc litchii]GMA69874.1 peptide ABC transporter permease [Leuconostoc litchii]
MQIRELIISSFRSLISNKRRSILTMIGIIIGIASVITILALGDGARLAMLKNLQADSGGQQSTQITFSPNNSDVKISGFNNEDLARIRSNPKVAKVTVQSDDHGILSSEGTINGKSLSSLVYLATSANDNKILAGRGIKDSDISIDRPVALVNKSIAKKGYRTIRNALNSGIEINGTTYTIIGVIDNNATRGEFYNYDVVVPRHVFETSNATVNANTLKLTFISGTDISKTTNDIKDQLNQMGSQHSSGSYDFYDTAAMLKGVTMVIKGITYFIVAVASISLFIAGIGVMNMMYIAVSERTQEIGIRMAVGASQKQILWQFLIEAVMLTLSGGMIGYLAGLGIAMGISAFLPFKASVSISTFLLAFGTSTIVGLVFGILPAKTASNKNLIDILR